MDWSTLQEWVNLALGFIAGGGLTTIFLLPSKRKKEEVSVVQDVQSTYKQMIDDLITDREMWKSKYEELQAEVDNIKAGIERRDAKITDLQQQLAELKSKPTKKNTKKTA